MSLFNATTKEQSNKHILQTNIKANANNQTKDVEKNEDYALKCGLVRCALQNRAPFLLKHFGATFLQSQGVAAEIQSNRSIPKTIFHQHIQYKWRRQANLYILATGCKGLTIYIYINGFLFAQKHLFFMAPGEPRRFY